MKKHFYLFLAILLLLTAFNISIVKASSRDNNKNEEPQKSSSYCPPASTPAPSTHLPINNGVMFLMIAGVAIGITTVNKANSNKALKA